MPLVASALALAGASVLSVVIAAVVALRSTGRAIIDAGYASYLGLPSDTLVPVLFRCVGNDVCSPNLGSAWWHYFPGWLLWVALGSIILLPIAIAVQRGLQDQHLDLATGRWSTKADLRRAGYLADPSRDDQVGYVGVHPSGKMLRVPEKIRFSHSLVLGGPGARKSTGYHFQNMLSDADDGWSAIIFDLKYPDPAGGFVSVLPYYEQRGYRVYAFTPYDDQTFRLPIIQDAANDRDARQIAEMIIPPDEDGNASFYRNSERRILAGLLMHAAKNNLSLTDLHAIVQRGPSGIQRFVNGQPQENNPTKGARPPYAEADADTREVLNLLFDTEPKQQIGLIDGIEGRLQFFADDRLGRATRLTNEPWSNIDLSLIGEEKTLLYVGLPQRNIDSGSGKLLLQLIKRLIDSALSDSAYKNRGALPNPVSFYLDEFPSLGRLPNIESNFATMRSRRVAYHLTIQNISQGKAIYGDALFKSFFTSNFQTVMLFPSFVKFEDAQYMSSILGNTMTTMEGQGQTHSYYSNSVSSNQREATRPLVTIDEMQTWPANEAIAMLNGVPHTRVFAPGIWEASTGGVKNPFKAAYDTLDHNLDAGDYITHLLEREAARAAQDKLKRLKQEARFESADAGPLAEPPRPSPALQAPAPHAAPRTEASSAPAAPAAAPTASRAGAAVSERPGPASPLTAPPALASAAATPTQRKVDPKKAVTRLVRSISEARANVRVNGDRQHRHVRALTVSTTLLREHLYPDEIATLEADGSIVSQGDTYLLNPHVLKQLDQQWYGYLVNQIPAGRDYGDAPTNTKVAAEGLRKLVQTIVDDDLNTTVRINGRTKDLERVEVSMWAVAPELRDEYTAAWSKQDFLRIEKEKGVAVLRPKGLQTLPDELKGELQSIYRSNVQAKRRGPIEPPAASSAPTPDAGMPSAPPPAVDGAPAADDGPPHPATQPDGASADPQSSADLQPSDATPPTPAKAKPRATKERPADERQPKPSPSASKRQPKPEPKPSRPTPGEAPATLSSDGLPPGVTLVRDPVSNIPTVQPDPVEASELVQRLRAWATEHSSRLAQAGKAIPPKERNNVVGIFVPDVLRYAQTKRAELGMPTASEDPVGPKGEPLASRAATGVVQSRSYVGVETIPADGLLQSLAWFDWVTRHRSRILGHPDADQEQEPLPYVEFQRRLIRVLRGEAEALLGTKIENRWIAPSDLGETIAFDLSRLRDKARDSE